MICVWVGDNVGGCLGLGHSESITSPQPIPQLCNEMIHTFITGYDFVLAMNTMNHVYSWVTTVWDSGQKCDATMGLLKTRENIVFRRQRCQTNQLCSITHWPSHPVDSVWVGDNSDGQIGCVDNRCIS